MLYALFSPSSNIPPGHLEHNKWHLKRNLLLVKKRKHLFTIANLKLTKVLKKVELNFNHREKVFGDHIAIK